MLRSRPLVTTKSILTLVGIVVGTIVLSLAYTYGTNFNRTIRVARLYVGNTGNTTGYYAIDEDGFVYKCSNSLYYWSWRAAENWNSMEVGKEYKISAYGWRIGALGMYPVMTHVISTD